ncbi:MAG TPA: methyl-accepting chemotaxis protein, partial [Candidatus Paceibacterota bacterium]|nr:methyl-accepting chemotaxis protein [Candidatus Paceibacterota bacterium]
QIAAASREQSQGISQVTNAVEQMDKMTQNNAASAEESAGAAEQLSAEVEVLKAAVTDLLALAGGAKASGSTGDSNESPGNLTDPNRLPSGKQSGRVQAGNGGFHRQSASREVAPPMVETSRR